VEEVEYSGRDNLEVMRTAVNYNKFLLDLVFTSARKGESIVDFGAGSGTFSLPMAVAGYDVTCIETDPTLSRELARQGMTVLPGLDQVEDESIDYIYSLNVLEHIEADSDIVALWCKKLRPGGKLMVYVPAFQILFSSMDHKVGHIRRYSRGELCRKLSNGGFEISEARYADSLGFFAALLYRLIDKGNGSIDSKKLRAFDRWIFPLSLILDSISHRLLGKNVYALAIKPIKSS